MPFMYVFLTSSLCTSFASFFFFILRILSLPVAVHCSPLLQYFNHLFRNCNLLWHLGSNITCTFLRGATLNLSFSMLFQYQLDFTFLCTSPGAWMSKSLLICKISLIIFYTPLNNGLEASFSCLFFLMTHHLAMCSWPGLKIHWCLSIAPSSIQYQQDL